MAIALGLIALIVAVLLFGEGSAGGRADSTPSSGTTYRNAEHRVEAVIPAGWRAIGQPINAVLYPPQVLAAASFR